MIKCIKLTFDFLISRLNECPVLVHILDKFFTEIYYDPTDFAKNDDHCECCVREFLDEDTDQRQKYEKLFKTPMGREMCSCTVLDMLFRTNRLLDDYTRCLVIDFVYKMFQNYHFKKSTVLSLAANYRHLMIKDRDYKAELECVSKEVLTSPNIALILFKRPNLWENMLGVFEEMMGKLKDTKKFSHGVFHVLNDF